MLLDSALPSQQTLLTYVAWSLVFVSSSDQWIQCLYQFFPLFQKIILYSFFDFVEKNMETGKSVMVLKAHTTEEICILCKKKKWLLQNKNLKTFDLCSMATIYITGNDGRGIGLCLPCREGEMEDTQQSLVHRNSETPVGKCCISLIRTQSYFLQGFRSSCLPPLGSWFHPRS